MRATLNRQVRRLIGKIGVPYNRRLGVRGSSHPQIYDAVLSLAEADSKTFRIQSGLPWPDCLATVATTFDLTGEQLPIESPQKHIPK
jgi:hypothetical protein